jgi:hypothetical protein
MLDLQIWHIVLTVVFFLFLGAFVGGRIAIVRSLAPSKQDAPHNLTTLLDEAAHAMAAHPVKEWPAQIAHFLKALDGKCGHVEYREMLEAVQNAITARLVQDTWQASGPAGGSPRGKRAAKEDRNDC